MFPDRFDWFIGNGSTAIFDPMSLSPIVWCDASDTDTITLNDGNVSAWNDKSGNNNHAVQATAASQPAYAANGITFDGVDDALVFGTAFTNTAGSTVFFVCEPKSIGINYMLGNVGGSAGKSRFYIREHAVDYGDTQISHSGLTVNERALISVWAGVGDATTQNVKVNNGDWVSGAVNRATPAGSQALASRGGTSSYSNVVIHEIIVFDKILSASEIQTVDNYLFQKWSI